MRPLSIACAERRRPCAAPCPCPCRLVKRCQKPDRVRRPPAQAARRVGPPGVRLCTWDDRGRGAARPGRAQAAREAALAADGGWRRLPKRRAASRRHSICYGLASQTALIGLQAQLGSRRSYAAALTRHTMLMLLPLRVPLTLAAAERVHQGGAADGCGLPGGGPHRLPGQGKQPQRGSWTGGRLHALPCSCTALQRRLPRLLLLTTQVPVLRACTGAVPHWPSVLASACLAAGDLHPHQPGVNCSVAWLGAEVQRLRAGLMSTPAAAATWQCCAALPSLMQI